MTIPFRPPATSTKRRLHGTERSGTRTALTNLYGDGIEGYESAGTEAETEHHAPTSLGRPLVENEIAQAVADQRVAQCVDGLKDMRMVAYDGVGTGIGQATGQSALGH